MCYYVAFLVPHTKTFFKNCGVSKIHTAIVYEKFNNNVSMFGDKIMAGNSSPENPKRNRKSQADNLLTSCPYEKDVLDFYKRGCLHGQAGDGFRLWPNLRKAIHYQGHRSL